MCVQLWVSKLFLFKHLTTSKSESRHPGFSIQKIEKNDLAVHFFDLVASIGMVKTHIQKFELAGVGALNPHILDEKSLFSIATVSTG